MGDKRAYFKVDVGYFTNPKVAAVLAESPTAIILHLESIAYSAQHLTDGLVPAGLVQRMVNATDHDAGLLFDAALWMRHANGKAEVHHYLEHQRSAEEAKKLSDAGRKGAASRWQSEPDAEVNADRIADAVRTPIAREKEREKEQHDAFDAFWTLYPKKEAKGAAVKAFKAAAKKADAKTITAGLQAQLPELVKRERKFIPLASSWLNAERWADEVEQRPVEPRSQWDRAVWVGDR